MFCENTANKTLTLTLPYSLLTSIIGTNVATYWRTLTKYEKGGWVCVPPATETMQSGPLSPAQIVALRHLNHLWR